jgi:hypothetical protein
MVTMAERTEPNVQIMDLAPGLWIAALVYS